jgi:hypothetical protein
MEKVAEAEDETTLVNLDNCWSKTAKLPIKTNKAHFADTGGGIEGANALSVLWREEVSRRHVVEITEGPQTTSSFSP